jgi:hypothetical protein
LTFFNEFLRAEFSLPPADSLKFFDKPFGGRADALLFPILGNASHAAQLRHGFNPGPGRPEAFWRAGADQRQRALRATT